MGVSEQLPCNRPDILDNIPPESHNRAMTPAERELVNDLLLSWYGPNEATLQFRTSDREEAHVAEVDEIRSAISDGEYDGACSRVKNLNAAVRNDLDVSLGIKENPHKITPAFNLAFACRNTWRAWRIRGTWDQKILNSATGSLRWTRVTRGGP